MPCRIYILLLATLLAMSPASAAQTWDAARDFAASNPNGAWSYGSGVTGTSFSIFPFYHSDCGDLIGVQGYVCWTDDIYMHTPLVGFNTTGGWLNWLTDVLPPHSLFLHPAPDWEPADTIIEWTAPATAAYRISGYFEILDTYPTGIIGSVFRNDMLLFKAELLGPGSQHPDQIGERVIFYFPELSLNAGDVISFGVNSDGTFYYDGTGFDATIVTPPNAPPCALCGQH